MRIPVTRGESGAIAPGRPRTTAGVAGTPRPHGPHSPHSISPGGQQGEVGDLAKTWFLGDSLRQAAEPGEVAGCRLWGFRGGRRGPEAVCLRWRDSPAVRAAAKKLGSECPTRGAQRSLSPAIQRGGKRGSRGEGAGEPEPPGGGRRAGGVGGPAAGGLPDNVVGR